MCYNFNSKFCFPRIVFYVLFVTQTSEVFA